MSHEMLLIVCAASLLIGCITGIASGLFGLGGGLVVIPSLLLLFHLINLPSHKVVHLVIGTSVTANSITCFVSMMKHFHKHNIVKRSAKILIPIVVIGSIIGASLAHFVSGEILKIIFGCILFFYGIRYVISKSQQTEHKKTHHPILLLIIVGGSVAIISGLLGLGGAFGVITLLSCLNTPFRKAIGTASVTSFFIIFTAAICYVIYGLKVHPISPYTFGYIFYPAAICIAISAASTVPIGVKLAHILPVGILKRIFGVVVITVGVIMVVKAVIH
jgi:uncharacterized protein